MIVIIDYGLGNIRAFANVYKNFSVPHAIASQKSDLEQATKIILPGVGAFDHAMESLQRSGMRELLDEKVLQDKVPVLGICVGMQILSQSSEEGNLNGLGWIDGVVKKIHIGDLTHETKLPHMGWNKIYPIKENPLLNQIEQGSRFYFLHSYYFHCNNNNDVLAYTEYGSRFPCIVNCGNIYGVQCHPEKSHFNGIQILKNFWTL